MANFFLATNPPFDPMGSFDDLQNTTVRVRNNGSFIIDGTVYGQRASLELYGSNFGTNASQLPTGNFGVVVSTVRLIIGGETIIDITDANITGNNLYRWLTFADGNAFDAAVMAGNTRLQMSNFSEAQNTRDGDDIVFAFGGNDVIDGSTGNDSIWGGTGDDVLTGGPGSDLLLGEAGFDVARFGYFRSGADWSRNVDGSWRVAATEGTDILGGIERLDFIGTSVFLDPARPRDTNGDARADFGWRGADGSVVVWAMDGLGIAGGGYITQVGGNWRLLGLAETDGNNRADMVWLSDAGQIQVWSMNGHLIAGAGLAGTRPTGTTFQALADLTGDGNADILWRDMTTGRVDLTRLDGVYTASAARTVATVGTNYSIVATGDLNGDYRADILWRGPSGELIVWAMNGAAVAGGGLVATVGLDWVVQGSADFNGDGFSDILWRNSNSGEVIAWLMQGQTVIGGGAVSQVGAFWDIEALGDLNGDGRADLIWRGADGTLLAWMMNGATVAGGGVIAQVGNEWSLV